MAKVIVLTMVYALVSTLQSYTFYNNRQNQQDVIFNIITIILYFFAFLGVLNSVAP